MLIYPLFNLSKVLDSGHLEAIEYFGTALIQRFLCFKILFGLPVWGTQTAKIKKKERQKQTNKQTNKQTKDSVN